MVRAIVLHAGDNVATLIDPGSADAECRLQGEASGTLRLRSAIPFGHKLCIRDVAAGAEVVKYGQIIGRANRAIATGEHAHTHNVESGRGRGDQARRPA